MLLLNTVYFKGQWAQKFQKEKTIKGRFYLSNQEVVDNVEYMRNTGVYKYFESTQLDAKILRIPYKVSVDDCIRFRGMIFNIFQDSPIAMYIILPNTKTGLKRLIKDMTNSVSRIYTYLMDDVNIELYLPKFKFTYKSQFAGILQKVIQNTPLKKILELIF